MEIQNEIIKTKKRIDLLEHQNEKFKALLDKALRVTKKTVSWSTIYENQFLKESIEVIEKEKENLKDDLSGLALEEKPLGQNVFRMVESLEKFRKIQHEEIESLKAEHAEIKFLLLHPESRSDEWLKNILKLDNDVSESDGNTCLVEERFRLQRKILSLEKKKAELLLAINDAAIPVNIGSFINQDVISAVSLTLDNDQQIKEYEDLRFKMLNLEDERSRLLGDLQGVLDRSRKEIAEEYNNLQEKIREVEQQKAIMKSCSINPYEQKVTSKELQNIFSAFRNLPLKEEEERARIERLKAQVGTMFCPGISLPVYCNIL